MADEGTPERVNFDDGRPKYIGHLLDGEMHGDWSWYRRDGSLMRTGTFDRGRQVGTWRTFDRSGAVVKESRFNP